MLTALVPNISIGIYNGKTIIETNILFFLRLIVNAAAMDPIKLIVGVPINNVINKVNVVVVSRPRTMAIKGATITIGKLDNNQWDKIFINIPSSISSSFIKNISKVPSS